MKILKRLLLCILVLLVIWIPVARMAPGFLVVEKPLEKADAILVLAGSSAYLERTQEAAVIFNRGVAPKILLTNDGQQGGWNQKEQRNPYFVELARGELIRQGVPEDAIEILPTICVGTVEEANLLMKTVADQQMKSILLVTSSYHSRRALWIFERIKSGSDLSIIIGIKSPSNQEYQGLFPWWLSVIGWQRIGLEYVKLIYYWLIY